MWVKFLKIIIIEFLLFAENASFLYVQNIFVPVRCYFILFFFHLASLKQKSGVASCSNFVARVTPALSLQTAILFLSLRVWHDVVARAIT